MRQRRAGNRRLRLCPSLAVKHNRAFPPLLRNREEIYIKRVVGLPGDSVRTLGYRQKRLLVPAGHCWIEGDNHANSIDSNNFGPVPLGLVQCKAVGVVWPNERRRFLTGETEAEKYAGRVIVGSGAGGVAE